MNSKNTTAEWDCEMLKEVLFPATSDRRKIKTTKKDEFD